MSLVSLFFAQNVPVGTWVTQVKASDEDDGMNGEVLYEFVTSVTNPNEDWLKFKINENTGEIVTDAEMDRETQSTYFVSEPTLFLSVYYVTVYSIQHLLNSCENMYGLYLLFCSECINA